MGAGSSCGGLRLLAGAEKVAGDWRLGWRLGSVLTTSHPPEVVTVSVLTEEVAVTNTWALGGAGAAS